MYIRMLTILLAILAIFWIPLFACCVAMCNMSRAKVGGGSRYRPKQHDRVSQLMNTVKNTMNVYDKPWVRDILENANTCVKFEDIPRAEPYAEHGNILRNNLHNGQLKLLLTEIQFLTTVLPSSRTPAYIVYAGSAPSHKVGILLKLFPNIKFLLVDPSEHMIMWPSYSDKVETQYDGHVNDVLYLKYAAGNRFGCKGRRVLLHGDGEIARDEAGGGSIPANLAEIMCNSPQRVIIIEDLFTDAISRQLYDLGGEPGQLLFISDIRTAASGKTPGNADIIWNSAMHYNWLNIMRPAYWMLKFRTPFMDQRTNIEPYMTADIESCPLDLAIRGEKWTFVKGDLYVQAFGRPVSTETRLVGSLGRDGALEPYDYNLREYEEKFHYYNNYHRNVGNHHDHAEFIDYNLGIDHCGDCALMCRILHDYYKKFTAGTTRETIVSTVHTIMQSIGRELRSDFMTHACYDITTSHHSLEEVIARMVRVDISRMLPARHLRQDTPATASNTAYLRAVWDKLPEIIKDYSIRESERAKPAFAHTNRYAMQNVRDTIWNSLAAYDLYGDCDFFRADLYIKLWLLFADYEKLAARLIGLLNGGRRANTAISPVFAEMAQARGVDQSAAEVCAAVSLESPPMHTVQSAELNSIIGRPDKLVEICTTRLDSYCDIVQISPADYRVCTFYGGESLDLGASYPGATIVVNLRAVSLPLLTTATLKIIRANPTNRIVIITWRNQFNGHGRMLTDDALCDESSYCVKPYLNVYEKNQ